MTRPLSLAHLTFLELAPPDLIRVAAEAGFSSVGLRLIAVTDTTPGYAVMDHPQMMRETLQAMDETGVTVNDIEFVRLTPTFDPTTFTGFLEAGAKLGAKYIVTAPYDPDLARLTDNLAAFAEQAAGFGLMPVLEFFPWTNVPDFAAARQIVQNTGERSVGILVDTLHFNRSQSRLSDLANTDPFRLPFLHLCDALVAPPYSTEALLHTAREARLPPGCGDIPLADIINALPADIPIAVEVPLQERPSTDPGHVARVLFAQTTACLGSASIHPTPLL